MNSSFSFAKVWFAFSLAALVFVYGVGVGKWEWFPHSFLDRAMDQARSARSLVSQDQGPTTFIGTPKYERRGVRIPKPGEMQPGLTLISSSWERSDGWDPELRLITSQGKVLHKWRVDRDNVFQGEILGQGGNQAGVHGSHLLPNGDVVVNLEYTGTVRLNSCGEVVWELQEGNHHSVAQDEDGSFWTPGVSSKPRQKSEMHPGGYTGVNKDVWVEYIYNISTDGKINKKINILDIIFNSNISYILREAMYNHKGEDITHMNDVEPLSKKMSDEYPNFESGDLLVSLLGLNLIFVFDPDNGSVKWHTTDNFAMQHDPDFVGDGWISVLDNNADWAGGSRIVSFKPSEDSIRIRPSQSDLKGFFTSGQGKHQRLDNGNILLSEANAGRAVEVSSEGQTVWEWIREPIDDSTVPKVTNAIRVDLTQEEVASWSCSSVDPASTSAQK